MRPTWRRNHWKYNSMSLHFIFRRGSEGVPVDSSCNRLLTAVVHHCYKECDKCRTGLTFWRGILNENLERFKKCLLLTTSNAISQKSYYCVISGIQKAQKRLRQASEVESQLTRRVMIFVGACKFMIWTDDKTCQFLYVGHHFMYYE